MALPDYLKYAAGTAIIWGEATSTGSLGTVTATLSLNALAAGSARMGAKVDLGASGSVWDQDFVAILAAESGTAPTAGGLVDLYLSWSHDNTNFAGGVSGSDGAWPTDGNEDEWAKQLGLPYISLPATNDGNTLQVSNPVIFRPKARYVSPVVDVNWDQAIRNQGTAANNLSRVLLFPLQSLIQDAA